MSTVKEYLEEQMDLRRICTIRFVADNGAVATVRTRITDLYNRDGKDCVKTEEGLEILQKWIVGINDHSFDPTC